MLSSQDIGKVIRNTKLLYELDEDDFAVDASTKAILDENGTVRAFIIPASVVDKFINQKYTTPVDNAVQSLIFYNTPARNVVLKPKEKPPSNKKQDRRKES